jgi:hypothetical protein
LPYKKIVAALPLSKEKFTLELVVLHIAYPISDTSPYHLVYCSDQASFHPVVSAFKDLILSSFTYLG